MNLLVDPAAFVKRIEEAYAQPDAIFYDILKFKDGRVLNGLITTKNDRTITLKTMTETLTVDRGDVQAIETSSASLMPSDKWRSASARFPDFK